MSKYFIHLLMYSTAETTQLYIKKLGISAEIKIFGKLHDGFVMAYRKKRTKDPHQDQDPEEDPEEDSKEDPEEDPREDPEEDPKEDPEEDSREDSKEDLYQDPLEDCCD